MMSRWRFNFDFNPTENDLEEESVYLQEVVIACIIYVYHHHHPLILLLLLPLFDLNFELNI